ncbi:MAG: ROK family protein [Nitrospirae bacterium]|nr:ROK family protein [Nitrospirota bacterium]
MGKDYSIGIDLGGTNLRVALVSRDGLVVDRTKVSSSGDLMASLTSAIQSLFNSGAGGIGLAVPGLVDAKRQRILRAPNLSILETIDVSSKLTARFGVPVFLENDANSAALGEMYSGAGKELDTFVLLTLGTGIGGAVIYKRKLLDVAGELGHIVVEANGRQCGCGARGCLEAYCSSRAIVEITREAMDSGRPTSLGLLGSPVELAGATGGCHSLQAITPKIIHEHSLRGDTLATEVLKQAGWYLGIGIANYINVFSPEAVVLTGGLTGAWDVYVKEAIRSASERAFKTLFQKAGIIRGIHGDNAGVIGAASMAFLQGSVES